MANADVRSFVMGHARAGIYDRHYRNTNIQLDTQAAFLEVPSSDALIKLSGHMSLTRDPSVETSIKIDKTAINSNPDVLYLESICSQLRDDIIKDYGKIKNSVGTNIYEKYQTEGRRLRTLKTKVKRNLETTARQEFFRDASSRYIDEQRRGIHKEFVEPKPKFQIHERNQLADLLFMNRDVRNMSEKEIFLRRLEAMKNLVRLCDLHMPRPAASRRSTNQEKILQDIPLESETSANVFPLVCPGTYCLFCLGNRSLCESSRQYAYSRKDVLQKHVEKHLRDLNWSNALECPHPLCRENLKSDMHFKSHAAKIHNILL